MKILVYKNEKGRIYRIEDRDYWNKTDKELSDALDRFNANANGNQCTFIDVSDEQLGEAFKFFLGEGKYKRYATITDLRDECQELRDDVDCINDDLQSLVNRIENVMNRIDDLNDYGKKN